MIFYRVKKEYDNCKRVDGSILVQNELYTEKEVQRYKIPMSCVDKVEEERDSVYWFFGARYGSVGYSD